MNDVVMKLIKGQEVTDEDLASELYEICSTVHGSCTDQCPVFKYNSGGCIPYEHKKITKGKKKGQWDLGACSCFKSGKKMLAFIRDRLPKAGSQSPGEPISMVAHGPKRVKSPAFVKLPRTDKMEEIEDRLKKLEFRVENHSHYSGNAHQ